MALKLFIKKKFLKSRPVVNQIVRKMPVVENEYGEFHAYGSIEESDYGIINDCRDPIDFSSQTLSLDHLDDAVLLALFRKLPAEDVSTMRLLNKRCNRIVKENEPLLAYRHIDYVSINQRRDGITKIVVITNKETRKEFNSQLIHLPFYLSRVSISRLDVTGKLCDLLLGVLQNVQADTFCMKYARVMVSPRAFSFFLRLLGPRSLIASQCKFDDAQLISDDLFACNPQIINVKITCTDEHWQSFPLLTDRILSIFSRRGLPQHFVLNNIESSISIHGIENMIESARNSASPCWTYQWMFGRILSTASTCLQTLSRVDDVTVMRIHKTHFCCLTDNEPHVRAYFFTKVDKNITKHKYYFC